MWEYVPQFYICTVQGYDKRHEQMRKFLRDMSIPRHKVTWNIVPRLHKGTQELSATDNHLQVMTHAVEHGYTYVCIFEDDLYGRSSVDIPRADDTLREYVEKNKTWDMLYLGHFPWYIQPFSHAYSVVPCISWCIHAYFISHRLMKHTIQYTAEQIQEYVAKRLWYVTKPGAMDTFLLLKCRDEFRSVCLYPQLVMQDSIKHWEGYATSCEWLNWVAGSWILAVILAMFLFTLVVIHFVHHRFFRKRRH